MFRILFFLLLVLALGFGFAWIADYPGTVKLDWQGDEYETSLIVVLAGLVALITSVLIVWAAIRIVLNSPKIMNRFFKQRKKDRGYTALSQGLIAAGSGDVATARRFAKESGKLLTSEPLVDLLDAQTLLLEGNNDKAREQFENMLEDDRTKLVALRGLYLEAEKQGAKEAAKQYVEEAATLAPSVPWAGNAMLRYRATNGDWAGALSALQSNLAAGLLEKDEAKRQRAILLTAYAMSQEQSEPAKAVKLSKEAHKLAPDLVPAAIVGARVLMRNNDLRKASKMIETVWKKEPHPELGEAYVHLRVGDSALDRMKRAKKLAGLKANHVEGNIAIAEAAIEAQDWEAARDAMRPVMTNAPTQRACMIMADIEEGESGDQGRMRDWLSRAVRAPKDAAWTADGLVSEKWLPFSPTTGQIDAFEWKVPVEQLGGAKNAVIDAGDLDELMSPLALGVAVGAVSEAASEEANEVLDAETIVPDSQDEALADDDIAEQSDNNIVDNDEVTEDEILETADAEVVEAGENDNSADTDANVVFPLDRRPDDPGINKESVDENIKKRFGLF